MWFIYDLLIQLYGFAIRVAAVFNPKARAWVEGRKSAPSLTPSPNLGKDRMGPTVWFHCASLGEFEQGRPVIEAFRQRYPKWKILLTFFSPSGYDVRKNYEAADWVFYLPLDTNRNAKKFIRNVNPSLVVFVKYEFWFRYLDVLFQSKIPVYVISAKFRPEHHFFKWYGGWALKQLKKVTRFFVQDESSAELLRAKGIEQVTVSGDTRFDRVAAVTADPKSFPLVEKFAGQMPVFLAGSTWPADEALILKLIQMQGDRMKFVIAPHEVHEERIRSLQSAVGIAPSLTPSTKWGRDGVVAARQGGEVIAFSQLTEENAPSAKVLLVDGIGYLTHLYQYATIAYIGGGFGAGIHNILEAAAFGKPVIFGPKYRKFREAVDLIDLGGASSIETVEQLNSRASELLDSPDLYARTSKICSEYVRRNCGATRIILEGL